MIRLNLLPDIKREFLKARRSQARVVSLAILMSLIAVGLTVAVALFVYGAQAIHKNILTDSIKKNQAELEKISDISKYVTVQNQLGNLSSLHDEKNDFSRLFGFLPILNPKAPNNVRLSNVNIDDESTTIEFQGETTDFNGLVTFRDMLTQAELSYRQTAEGDITKSKLFSEIAITEQTMSKATNGGTVVTFKVVTKYNPVTFKHSTREATVSVPTLETTPSKQDSPTFSESTVQPSGGAQ